MKQMLPKFVSSTYATYRGDGESHRIRLIGFAIAGLVISSFGVSLGETALPAMALTVSVLAGFTFTALFSSHAISFDDLPPPRNESDALDRQRLTAMLANFRQRSRYFLIASVVCLLSILVLSIRLDFGPTIEGLTTFKVGDWKLEEMVDLARQVGAHIFKFIVVFVVLEVIYTFYRLSETIFAIIDTRRSYLEHNPR